MGPAILRVAAVVALGLLALAATAALMRRGRPRRGDAMPWTQHIEELRRALMVSGLAFMVATMVVFSVRIEGRGGWPWPVLAIQDNLAAQVFRVIADHLVPEGVTLMVSRPLDGFVAEATLALAMGAVIASPVWMLQLIGYFGPALEAHERRTLLRGVVPAIVLFGAGVAFAWVFVLPFLLDTLYGYPVALGATPFLQVSELVRFTLALLFIFGLAFQLPLVMAVLGRTGLVTWRSFLKAWRVALVIILVASALMTDPTVVSQVMVAGPLMALYGLGILAARITGRRAETAAA